MEIRDFLLACRVEFQKDSTLGLADQVLKRAFCYHWSNSELSDVVLKVIVLNKLYKTNIYSEFKLARHICSLNSNQDLDKCLLSGDTDVVRMIRQGHGIVSKKGKEIDYYSFAAKFCHWSLPFDYPVYDSFVAVAIQDLIGKEIPEPDFAIWTDLKNYLIFKKVIDYLKRVLNFSNLSYKDFDEVLWIYGKFLGKKLPSAIQTRLEMLERKP